MRGSSRCEALLGGGSAALLGPYLVLVILACGLAEMTLRSRDRPAGTAAAVVATGVRLVAGGGLAAPDEIAKLPCRGVDTS
jgi:hypothetical protein